MMMGGGVAIEVLKEEIGTGTGGSGAPNFSYLKILETENIEVPENQQMIFSGHLTVLGHLSVNGDILNISNRKPEAFFYTKISVDDVVEVPANRLLLYKNHITIEGHLRVNGTLGVV